MSKPEYEDRYTALGITPPPPETVCQGECEGTGWVPIFSNESGTRDRTSLMPTTETDPRMVALWREAEQVNHTADGWHFVKCPDCHGTGVRS